VTVPEPLSLYGVVHLVRHSGRTATDVAALREHIAQVPDASLFYHAHHPRLRHAHAPTPPMDDFSAWMSGVVQDRETAERVAFAVQTAGRQPAELRAALLAAIPEGGARPGPPFAAPPEGEFVFLEMDSVPVDLGLVAHDTDELMTHLCGGSVAIFFYHVLECPWFDAGGVTVSEWARAWGDARLADWIEESAHDGRPLADSQRRLGGRWRRSQMMRRVAMSADVPEGVRQAQARNVVSGLVRRITREG
jgi:hypothetical protein